MPLSAPVPALALTLTLTLTLLGGLALSARSAAAEDLPPRTEFFDEYDKDSDGKVTIQEFGGSSAIFDLLDKNKDGDVTPAELGLPATYKPDPKRRRRKPGGGDRAGRDRAGRGGPQKPDRGAEMRKRVAAMDANKDGKVTREEWKGPDKLFARMDRNKDGVLDAQDRKRPGGKKGGGKKGGGSKTAGPEAMGEKLRKRFAALDKNADGALTAEEAPHPGLLKMADANGDGRVTQDEFLDAMKKRMQRRGPGGRDKKDGDKKDSDKRGRGKKGSRGARRRGGISAGRLKSWDRDGDGKVSRDEFPGRDQVFDRNDTDKDGFLTEADAVAAKKAADGSAPEGKKEGAGGSPEKAPK